MVLMRDHVIRKRKEEVKEGKRKKGKEREERVRKRGGAGQRGMVRGSGSKGGEKERAILEF